MATTHYSGPVQSTNGFIGAVTGNVTGTVTGNVTGNVTGDVTGAVLGTAASVVVVTAASLAVTAAAHSGRVVSLNLAAGQAVTLPSATGSGSIYRFVVGITVTTPSTTIKVNSATGTDNFDMGRAYAFSDNAAQAVIGWVPTAGDDTITLNGTTTGGYIGDQIELVDIATGKWAVKCFLKQTGVEATPFSATVA